MRSPVRAAPVVLGLALLAGSAVRVEHLASAELTTDEAFSWRMSTYPPRAILSRTAADVHPPLYYLVLAGWRGLVGDSPSALRSLSLLFGLGTVVVGYVVARALETPARQEDRIPGSGLARGTAAGAAAVLLALHADQVAHSRAVRMYAMGVLLAGLSAWLMLRALAAGRRAAAWWAAYAVVAAALCYTHYYGAFTVAAELAFAAMDAWGRRERARGPDAVAVLAAGAAVAGLFAPWLPVLRRQAARVSADYWIREEGTDATARALVRWICGIDWWPPWPTALIVLIALVALWTLWRGDRGQRFLALQAVVPWVAAAALSASAGRPLVLERYLVFAQFALVVWLARWWAGLDSAWSRSLGALALGALVALGLAGEVGGRSSGASSAEAGARLLVQAVAPGDLVLANAPRDLDVVRYYLDREGGRAMTMRCPASRSVGHLSQVSSLGEGEIIDDADVWSGTWPRVWRIRLHPTRKWRPDPPPAPWRVVMTHVFEGPASTRLYVEVSERAGGPRPPR